MVTIHKSTNPGVVAPDNENEKWLETIGFKPFFIGAGDRGRTGTDFTPLDFESSESANSTTPAFAT